MTSLQKHKRMQWQLYRVTVDFTSHPFYAEQTFYHKYLNDGTVWDKVQFDEYIWYTKKAV